MDADTAPAPPVGPPRHRRSPPALHRLLVAVPGVAIDWRSTGPSSSRSCTSRKKTARGETPQIRRAKAEVARGCPASCSCRSLLEKLLPCGLGSRACRETRATLTDVVEVLIGGTVQGATPTWFLAGWTAFRRNPGAH